MITFNDILANAKTPVIILVFMHNLWADDVIVWN